MNDSLMEAKPNYNSFELKPKFSIGYDDPVASKGKPFSDTIYSEDKIPFSSSNRSGKIPFISFCSTSLPLASAKWV